MTELDELLKPTLDEVTPDFVVTSIKRGLEVIQPILNLLEGKNAFICGGYARYCASPNEGKRLVKAGDVDIYCYNEDAFEQLYQHFKDVGLEIRFDTDVALTYKKTKDKENPFYGCPVIQLIKPLDQGAIVARKQSVCRHPDAALWHRGDGVSCTMPSRTTCCTTVPGKGAA